MSSLGTSSVFDPFLRIGYNQRMPLANPLRAVFKSLSTFVLAALACGMAIADEQGDEFFEKQVRPILVSRCFSCHSGKLAEDVKVPQGNLRLDSREAALKGLTFGRSTLARTSPIYPAIPLASRRQAQPSTTRSA